MGEYAELDMLDARDEGHECPKCGTEYNQSIHHSCPRCGWVPLDRHVYDEE